MRHAPLSRPHLLRSLSTLVLLVLAPGAWAQQAPPGTKAAPPSRTQVNDVQAREQLLGAHALTLQWVSYEWEEKQRKDKPGKATVTEKDGLLTLEGEHSGAKGGLLRVDGAIERVDAKSFILVGRVETRMGFVNDGQPCVREGRFTFRMTGKRRYWRLQQMDNPCSDVTDYVDVYLR